MGEYPYDLEDADYHRHKKTGIIFGLVTIKKPRQTRLHGNSWEVETISEDHHWVWRGQDFEMREQFEAITETDFLLSEIKRLELENGRLKKALRECTS